MTNDRAFNYIKYCLYLVLSVAFIAVLPIGLPVLLLLIVMYERKDMQLKYFGNRYYKTTLQISDTDFIKKMNSKLISGVEITKNDFNSLKSRVDGTQNLLSKKEGNILDNIGKEAYEVVLMDMEKKGYLKEYRSKINESLLDMYFAPVYGFIKLADKVGGLRSKYCYLLIVIEILLWIDVMYITGTLEGVTRVVGLGVSGTIIFCFYLVTRFKLLGEYLTKQQEEQMEGFLETILVTYNDLEVRLKAGYERQIEESEIKSREIGSYLSYFEEENM